MPKYSVINPVDWKGAIIKSGSIETDETNDADIQPLVNSCSVVLDAGAAAEQAEADRKAAEQAEADRKAAEEKANAAKTKKGSK